METQIENSIRRLQHVSRLLTGAAVALGITIVLLLIIDFMP